jgi:hypothetical protein
MPTPAPNPAAPRRRRRWPWLLAAGLVLPPLLLVALLPAGLGTPPARRWLLERANRVLAPDGRLEVASFRFSWFGPTRMTGFTLRDGRGKVLVAAPVATWDRRLDQILFDRPRYGRLTLSGGRLDIERRADGTVDLLVALGPILTPDPLADWTIRLADGFVRVVSPELARPLAARRGTITIRRPAAPRALTWEVELADGPGQEAPALAVRGGYNRWHATAATPGDLSLSLSGRDWPLELNLPQGSFQAPFRGQVEARRLRGQWTTTGRLQPADIAVTPASKANAPTPWRLDGLAASWDVVQQDHGWNVRSLDLASRFGTIRAKGSTDPDAIATHVEGSLNLAELLALLPPDALSLPEELRLDGATAAVSLDALQPTVSLPKWIPVSLHGADRAQEATHVEGEIRLSGVAWHEGLSTEPVPPITLGLDVAYDPAEGGALNLARLSLDTALGTLQAKGRVTGLAGPRRLLIEGAIEPAPNRQREAMAEALGDEAEVMLGPIGFQAAGVVPAKLDDLARSLDAEVRVPVRSAEFAGLKLGPTDLVARSVAGTVGVDPVHTTLNGGEVALRPELIVADGWTSVTLRLTPGSFVRHAEINDEVSRRVLAFVVPTFAEATRARGLVSVEVTRAEFPLIGEGRTVVEGNIVFEDVEFAPGPLADELLGLAADGPSRPVLRLDQPVVLAVYDGKVHQRGLSIPLGNVAHVQMEGTVDFDKNLDLAVTIPLSTERLAANRPVLGFIAAGVRPTIPIRGTLDEPRVDTEALGKQMGQMGLDVAERAGIGFAGALLQKMMTPRTPEEQARIDEQRARRKAIQEQKKLERRMRRRR